MIILKRMAESGIVALILLHGILNHSSGIGSPHRYNGGEKADGRD